MIIISVKFNILGLICIHSNDYLRIITRIAFLKFIVTKYRNEETFE